MGAATAEVVRDAGAEVVVMDRAEIGIDGVRSIALDLSDKASIEAAAGACGGPVDAVFSCAGVADGTPGIEKVNFVVQSHGVPFVFDDYEVLGTFGDLERLLPEPVGEVGPEEPDLLDEPETIDDAYPLELDIVEFGAGG